MNDKWAHLINGRMVEGLGSVIKVDNPADGTVLAEFRAVTANQAMDALKAAKRAFPQWATFTIRQREEKIEKLADLLDQHRDEIIDLLVKETGKPYPSAEEDFQMLPDCLRFFAAEARHMEGKLIPDYDGQHMITSY